MSLKKNFYEADMNFLKKLKVFRKTFLTPLKARTSYSQCSEDLIVEQFFKSQIKNCKNGTFVDVGSHHPRRGSNTYKLYKCGWRGFLIDMEDEKVFSAKLARPGDVVIKAAVSDKKERVNIYSPRDFSTNATISEKISKLQHSYKKIGVIDTKRLDEILIDNSCPYNFEFLNIDIEGNDLKAIQGLSLKKFKPILICIENYSAQSGINELLKSEIHKYLEKFNYSLIGITGPSTFYAKELRVENL